MEIKPVKTTAAPQYPKREAVSAGQIKSSVPLRWTTSRTAKAALATLAAMSLAGCTRTAGVPLPPSPATEETATQSPIVDDIVMGEAMAPTISVAPLFLHGDGHGAFGCMMVAPPAFLSEDEALAVINAVAADYGLKFTDAGGPVLEGVLQPVTDIYDADEPAPSDTYVTFTPDFTDPKHGVSIEFVSTQDMKTWNHGGPTTVETRYDTKDAAAQLSEALEYAYAQDYEAHAVGVLYDPLAYVEPGPDKISSQVAEERRALEQEQLSAQVRDFCEWLKDEGII